MRLPRLVDPRKLANQGARFDGEVPTEDMARLREAVQESADQAAVTMAFYIDEARHVVVEGHFSLTVTRLCQRCLQPVSENLEGDMQFGVVWAEERMEVLPRKYDPWLIEGDSADLYQLIEDEILLSLPFVAYHDENSCPGKGRYSTGEFEEVKQNPFGILAQLKK